ncbi:MAG: tRNA (adenosine(37)-N6)-threonylcarbamoyltransferase complex dimerization subunit type 1 TsaB [Sedimentisphaerales bacterium]|nr:tRNA (adenosine(37)-N6)-threonylcarbamoyltransferase complex dimerization subunit type 1 TsaB [Sedimentisphaerales bacterium]
MMMQEPLILAVETSSRMGSVALAFGEKLVSETRFSSPLKHSVEIFPAVCGLLDCAGRSPGQIEQVYISHGPGSFTGLRIAATLAKTMHLANATKIITVDTLDIIAANVTMDDGRKTMDEFDRMAVILDAKRGQFFIAVYELAAPDERSGRGAEDALWKKVVPDSLLTISDFLDHFVCPENPIWLLGDGLVYYRDRFKADGVFFLDEQYWSPQANKVHLLGWQMALNGQFADPLTLTPNYLRKPDVTLKSR